MLFSTSYAKNFTITFDWSTHKKSISGSDNFPVTWADDDHQYTVWGDGHGFDNSSIKISLGVSKIIGDPHNYYGKDIWYSYGKSYGIICVDRILYMWVTRDPYSVNFPETLLYKSINYGSSWTRTAWTFPKELGIVTPKILQFGKNYTDSIDNYVYFYFTKYYDGAFKIQKPGQIHIFRAPKTQLMVRDSYEFFNGYSWTPNLEESKSILSSPDGFGLYNSISYNKPLNKYFLITEHTESFKGNISIYSSDYPWGPWELELKQNGFGIGYIEQTTFFWNFSNKWLSSDGKDFVIVFTGIGTNDAFHTIHGHIEPIKSEKPNIHFIHAINLLLLNDEEKVENE